MLFLGLLLSTMTCTVESEVLDLSHVLGPQSYHHPGDPAYNHTSLTFGNIADDVFLNRGFLVVPEHAGTHIDAPAHFVKDGATLEQLGMEDLIADGVMIDMQEQAKANQTYLVKVQDLLDWEDRHGRIPDQAAVVFNFGWSEKFSNLDDFTGSKYHANFSSFRFPAVSHAAGEWLLKKRDIKIIAVDTLSPDPAFIEPDAPLFSIHVTYLPRRKLLLENVKIHPNLPSRHFRLYAMPYRFAESSGAPTRVFAITYQPMNGAAARMTSPTVMAAVVGIVLYKFFYVLQCC